MLTDWIHTHVPSEEQNPKAVILLVFYENEAEKQKAQALLEEMDVFQQNAVFFISTSANKKLAASCEISRTPTLLFWCQGMEIARLNRISSAPQMQAALESVQQL